MESRQRIDSVILTDGARRARFAFATGASDGMATTCATATATPLTVDSVGAIAAF